MKLTLAVLAIVAAAAAALAQSANPPINNLVVWDNVRVGTNAVSRSRPLEIQTRSLVGNVSLQFGTSSSTGSIKRLYYEASLDGLVWCVPDGAIDIDTTISIGTNLYGVVVPLVNWLRFVAVTTNDGANISATAVYQ